MEIVMESKSRSDFFAIPKTKKDFEKAIQGRCKWATQVVDAEPEDRCKKRTIYYLMSDPQVNCFVSFEYGRLFVSFGQSGSYDFELDRLAEDGMGGGSWSWTRQLEQKNWAMPVFFEMLDELYDMFIDPEERKNPRFAPAQLDRNLFLGGEQ